ncbi:MAG TPA: efflux RND transporter periplasmic adaptor subunit [Thermoanaerobaculia bacterium]|nr:efflux RND transporter periplasmic adaptor subunit [Thermoanaerobaculia bacterium]
MRESSTRNIQLASRRPLLLRSLTMPLIMSLVMMTSLLIRCGGGSAEREPQPPFPIRSEVVAPAEFRPSLTVLGTVHPSETISITSSSGGTISYPARFRSGLRTGERVSAGEVLAILENESSRAHLEEAQLQAEERNLELERSRRSFQQGIIAQAELSREEVASRMAGQRLASAERQAKRLLLRASRAGYLIVNTQYPDRTELAPQIELAQIAVGGRPRVIGFVAAADRAKLRRGQSVRFLSGSSLAAAEGSLSEVATVVDLNGTAKIVANATESSSLPAPGEGVEMQIALDTLPSSLTIPEEALVLGSGGAAVFVVQERRGFSGGNRVKRVTVQTGGHGGGRVEITAGLARGDRVVVSGAAFLTDGAPVTEAPDTSSAAP